MLGVVTAVALATAALLTGTGLVAVIYRWQARRFNSSVAKELLDDWEQRLELLDDAERRHAELSPPSNVVAAMVSLPVRGRTGLREGWTERPVESFDGQ
jgi:hypothetical protein